MLPFIITILSGLSFFIGYLITKFIKDEKKLTIFSVGFSFVIIIGLILFDLLPECIESIQNKWLILLYILIGIIGLKSLDLFVPDHHHSNKKDHMEHIGIISFIALFLHNLVEGTGIYATSITDISMGVFMALGVSFHNIPLGIQISSLIKNTREKIILLCVLALSSVFGVIFLNIFNITMSDNVLGILISITLGMLIYIAFFELLCEIKEHFKDNELKLGLLIGIIILIFSQFLH